MLDLAINHIPDLQSKYAATLFDPRYKYYRRSPDVEYYIPITQDSHVIQMVSLNEKREVTGYLATKINRMTQTAYDYEVMSFTPGRNRDLTPDMAEFDLFLFNELGVNRLVWSMVVDNPIEPFYDRLVDTCGVRIVGTFKNDVMLPDGKLYDLKFYELLKEDFFEAIKRNKINPQNYRYATYKPKGVDKQ